MNRNGTPPRRTHIVASNNGTRLTDAEKEKAKRHFYNVMNHSRSGYHKSALWYVSDDYKYSAINNPSDGCVELYRFDVDGWFRRISDRSIRIDPRKDKLGTIDVITKHVESVPGVSRSDLNDAIVGCGTIQYIDNLAKKNSNDKEQQELSKRKDISESERKNRSKLSQAIDDVLATLKLDSNNTNLIGVPWHNIASNSPAALLKQSNLSGKAQERGIEGELKTADELKKLQQMFGEKYCKILHAIPLTDSMDLDHIVICPTGIFVINSKNYSKGMRVVDNIPYTIVDGREREQKKWIDIANNNCNAIAGRLINYGYQLAISRIPIVKVFAVWGGQLDVESTGIPKSDCIFCTGNRLNDVIFNYASRQKHADGKKIILDPQLILSLYLDMRRETFWRQ